MYIADAIFDFEVAKKSFKKAQTKRTTRNILIKLLF